MSACIKPSLNAIVTEWLAKLSDKHRWVIERRFGLNNQDMATLEELAKDLQVTRERVRQIQVEAQKELAIGLREKGVYAKRIGCLDALRRTESREGRRS